MLDIHDLGLARERGSDFVGVGALVQRPLAAIIARSDVKRPRDLEGRRVGVSGLPSDPAVLKAYHWPGNIRQLENAVARMVASYEDFYAAPSQAALVGELG